MTEFEYAVAKLPEKKNVLASRVFLDKNISYREVDVFPQDSLADCLTVLAERAKGLDIKVERYLLRFPIQLATPIITSSTAPSNSLVQINWDAVQHATAYRVRITKFGDNFYTEYILEPSELSYGGAVPSTRYDVVVTAISSNAKYSESKPASTFVITGPAIELTPPDYDFMTLDFTDNQVTITWEHVANRSGYKLRILEEDQVTLVDEATVSAATDIHVFTGLNAATPYVFTIQTLGNGIHYLDSPVSQFGGTTNPL